MIKKRRNFYQKITACGLSAMMLLSGVLPNGTALSVQAASEPAEQYNITENGDMTYVATMKNDASYDRVIEKAESMDVLAEEQPVQLEENNVAVLELDENDVNRIEQMKGVVSLEEDVILTANEEVPIDNEEVNALVEENAELPFSQWNLDAINLPDSLSLTGDTVKVAVLDSGISASEDILVSNYTDLTDSGNENAFFNDSSGHGTSIAAVIAASGTGDMEGIAPGVELYDVKVLNGSNTAPLSKIIESIYWCIDNDIDIMNMSFGTTAYSASLEQAIDAAAEAGIIMVAAAGNNGNEAVNIDYPAAFDNVIAVGASDGDNVMTDFTSRGDGIDILAPGEKIWSYGAFAGLQALDGTSIATAHVTGAAALLLEKYPNADTEFIRQLFMASSNQESGRSDLGILNIGDALSMADDFQVQEASVKIQPQAPSATTYDTSDIVSGSWGGSTHGESVRIIDDIKKIRIAADAAANVDGLYSSNASKAKVKQCRPLHGVYNYVANLHFLYEVAKGAKSVDLSNASKVTDYVKKVNVQHSYDATYGNSSINLLRDVLVNACTGSNGLTKKLEKDYDYKFNTNEQRIYVILGMAAHLLGDTFAHRTMVPKNVNWGSTKDNHTFIKGDFTNLADFQNRVKAEVIEFRDIKNYLNSSATNIYTDQTDFYSNRYTATKKAVANLFKRYSNNKPFSVLQFYTETETGFGRKLNNLTNYAKSAGYNDEISANSSKGFRVDKPGGKFKENELDYKDYITYKLPVTIYQ